MAKESKFVEISDALAAVIGRAREGTRIFEREGYSNEIEGWFDAICEHVGKTVSPGGVRMFVPVSRAAVHQRVKEGKMTAFTFKELYSGRGFFARKLKEREKPLVYIPVEECKAWAVELKERMLASGEITLEELEGDQPDWSGEIWDKPKQKRSGK